MRRFPYFTFKENVAIALAVAELAGVDRATALKGMIAARPDPGTVAVAHLPSREPAIAFANIFAANDPASTLMNINLLTERGLISPPFNVVINCRPDRIERNGQMGELTGRLDPERIVLIGEHTRSAKVAVPAELADRVVDLGGSTRLHRPARRRWSPTGRRAGRDRQHPRPGRGPARPHAQLPTARPTPRSTGSRPPTPPRSRAGYAPHHFEWLRAATASAARSDLLTDTSTGPSMTAGDPRSSQPGTRTDTTPTAADAIRTLAPQSRPSPWPSACCSPWPAT